MYTGEQFSVRTDVVIRQNMGNASGETQRAENGAHHSALSFQLSGR
jgi:hypothetical protein